MSDLSGLRVHGSGQRICIAGHLSAIGGCVGCAANRQRGVAAHRACPAIAAASGSARSDHHRHGVPGRHVQIYHKHSARGSGSSGGTALRSCLDAVGVLIINVRLRLRKTAVYESQVSAISLVTAEAVLAVHSALAAVAALDQHQPNMRHARGHRDGAARRDHHLL